MQKICPLKTVAGWPGNFMELAEHFRHAEIAAGVCALLDKRPAAIALGRHGF